MGWSCSAIAGATMERMIAESINQSGSQNVYKHNEKWYMWETSGKEYEDGSISGSIDEFTEDPRGKDRISARRVGKFRISGKTGKLTGGYGITKLGS